MKAYNFRFEESDVNTWKLEAKESGESLSSWIRQRCNEACKGPTKAFLSSAKEFTLAPDPYTFVSDAFGPDDNGTVGECLEFSAEDCESTPLKLTVIHESSRTAPELQAEIEKYYHTASSNRLTCMCESCVDYRTRNDIPFGGKK